MKTHNFLFTYFNVKKATEIFYFVPLSSFFTSEVEWQRSSYEGRFPFLFSGWLIFFFGNFEALFDREKISLVYPPDSKTSLF
jgi:hypothetical protein